MASFHSHFWLYVSSGSDRLREACAVSVGGERESETQSERHAGPSAAAVCHPQPVQLRPHEGDPAMTSIFKSGYLNAWMYFFLYCDM